ncbi:MAG: hypothetical protein WBM44_11825 [Waterburya sp.]
MRFIRELTPENIKLLKRISKVGIVAGIIDELQIVDIILAA